MKKINLLLVEDDALLRSAIQDTLESGGYVVKAVEDGHQALEHLSSLCVDGVISDVQMNGLDGIALLEKIKCDYPLMPVILMTAYGTVDKAVSAIRKGASDYLVKPFDSDSLLTCISKNFSLIESSGTEPIAVEMSSIKLLQLAKRVASSDVSVLINGESGSGKEVIAQYIHEHSARHNGPFVAINCAAIPENMLEAVLFGYEKGAFTGAHQMTQGKFEQAQGGTLLLDEISEMDINLQAKILRVLQERELERLGGRKTIKLNVRILATTNRNLMMEVSEKRFREDLYYRLNVFPITVLPLRDRIADIEPLARRMIEKHFKNTLHQTRPDISEDALLALKNHVWPGNVRELENVIQRALVICSDSINSDAICFENSFSSNNYAAEINHKLLTDNVRQRESELILKALKTEKCSRKEIAEKLGISPRTLRYKISRMREQGIAIPKELSMINM